MKRYRNWWINTYVCALSTVMALVGLSMLLAGDDPDAFGRILGGVIAIIGISTAMRALAAGITVNDDAVVVRKLYYTRRIPWSRVARFTVHLTNVTLLPWHIVAIERADGGKTLVSEIGSTAFIRAPTRTHHVVDTLNAELHKRRPRPEAA
jgi:hypothetical protein